MHFMTFGTNFRDAVIVAFTNCATSVFAAIIIFAIMGFKVNRNKNLMIDLENEKICLAGSQLVRGLSLGQRDRREV